MKVKQGQKASTAPHLATRQGAQSSTRKCKQRQHPSVKIISDLAREQLLAIHYSELIQRQGGVRVHIPAQYQFSSPMDIDSDVEGDGPTPMQISPVKSREHEPSYPQPMQTSPDKPHHEVLPRPMNISPPRSARKLPLDEPSPMQMSPERPQRPIAVAVRRKRKALSVQQLTGSTTSVPQVDYKPLPPPQIVKPVAVKPLPLSVPPASSAPRKIAQLNQKDIVQKVEGTKMMPQDLRKFALQALGTNKQKPSSSRSIDALLLA